VSFDAGILNNPSKKLLKPSNTVGEAAWNEIVAKDDSTETFGQCIAGKARELQVAGLMRIFH